MSQQIVSEVKNKLYFNKFEYKAVCKIQGAAYTYYTPDLDTFVARMDKLKDVRTTGNKFGVRILDMDWKEYWDEVNVEQISKFLTWRNMINKNKALIRIQADTVSFFSNDLNLLKTLDSIDPKMSLFKARVLGQDTIYFVKSPKFKLRTYFKGKRCPEDFLANILEFVKRYPNIQVSPGLCNLAQTRHSNYTRYMYLHSSYHIDYDDESMISILHMLFPNMIGKTYSLAKRP